jgi:hypothetical protein
VLDIFGKQLRVEEHCCRRDREIRSVDPAIAGQPRTTEITGFVSNLRVQGVPRENGEQSASWDFLLGPHASQHFEPSHLTCVEWANCARIAEEVGSSSLTAEDINEHRRVNENAHCAPVA